MDVATWEQAGVARDDSIDGQFTERGDELRSALQRAVRRVCPAWLAADAEDLVQESLIRVLQRSRSMAAGARLSASYLHKVAYSAVVDEIRRRRRRVEAGMRDDTALTELPDARDEASNAAIGDGIAHCIGKQNEDRRRALTLYLLGNSIADTANLLGGPSKRAENLIFRGLQQLRVCLDALGLAL